MSESMVAMAGAKVTELADAHSNVWREQPEAYWFMRLAEELGELSSSLNDRHNDSVECELAQVAAICVNWLGMRAERNPESYAELTQEVNRLVARNAARGVARP